MQLIIDSEPGLALERDMSAIDDIEKVGNGNIEQLSEKNCNGNKENIGEVNIITNDQINKQTIDTEDISEAENETKSINPELEKSNGLEITETEVNETAINGEGTKESQSNGENESSTVSTEEPTQIIQEIKCESETSISNVNNTDETKDSDEETINNDTLSETKSTTGDELASTDIIVAIPDKIKTETDKIEAATNDVEAGTDIIEVENDKIKETDMIEIENDKIKETDMIEIENDKIKETDMIEVENDKIKVETDKIEATTNNVEAATNNVEGATNNVEAATNNVEAATNNVETATNNVESATDDVDMVTDSIEAATDSSEAVADKIETATNNVETAIDATDSSEMLTDTVDLNKPASEPATAESVKAEVALTSPKDDVEVIEAPKEPVKIDEDLPEPDVILSEESESTTKNNEKMKVTENDKKDDDSSITVEINDAEPTAGTMTNDAPIEVKDDMDVEVIEETKNSEQSSEKPVKDTPSTTNSIIEQPVVCKLSNTLDILSDDEDEPPKEPAKEVESNEKQCINIEDDDDIMLIDEDTSKTETPPTVNTSIKENDSEKADVKADCETGEKPLEENDLFAKTESQDSKPAEEIDSTKLEIDINEKEEEKKIEKFEPALPLIPENFLKSAKKNIADMTREDLEEFCILKIVESIVDRSSLSDIKSKLKSVAQGVEEYRKKITMLTKQNLDLQVVLKSIQEEQKKAKPDTPITPLKITRSVGMQVFMEKSGQRRKNLTQPQLNQVLNNTTAVNRQTGKPLPSPSTSTNSPRPQKPQPNNPNIPVPRLVPAVIKTQLPLVNQTVPGKTASPMPNGVRNPSPQKVAEKRPHNKAMSVTVDLTDDEPPAKVNNRTSPAPPVRVVPSHSLMPAPRQSLPVGVNNNQRKVYIPISGQQNHNIRPGQTIMLKTVPTPGLRPKGPNPQVARVQNSSIRMASNVRPQSTGRHPAPLPDAMKQYQPPNWKALPPAPEIKLSKVENGIVISWKIESYQEDLHEEIASYQLYAYQETSCPPSTTLWKKIGDVKALPLPMACTLTQFMAGFKYYFAVRAVDIRSRLGPFSLPGSILLLNKL